MKKENLQSEVLEKLASHIIAAEKTLAGGDHGLITELIENAYLESFNNHAEPLLEKITNLEYALKEYIAFHERLIDYRMLNPAAGMPIRIRAKSLLD